MTDEITIPGKGTSSATALRMQLLANGCSVEGCNKTKLLAKGLCNAHYLRNYRHGSPTGGSTGWGEARRWLLDALETDTDACIPFPYGTYKGYGAVNIDGKTMAASRFIAIQAYGDEPGLEAAHGCGNRACCNKKHIRWATHAENMADMIAHGRTTRGRAHPRAAGINNKSARFSERDVRDIRSVERRVSARRLASLYGVTHAAILNIWTRKTWRHI